MRAFADAWPDPAFVQEVLAQLPWYHQLTLLESLPSIEQLEKELADDPTLAG